MKKGMRRGGEKGNEKEDQRKAWSKRLWKMTIVFREKSLILPKPKRDREKNMTEKINKKKRI